MLLKYSSYTSTVARICPVYITGICVTFLPTEFKVFKGLGPHLIHLCNLIVPNRALCTNQVWKSVCWIETSRPTFLMSQKEQISFSKVVKGKADEKLVLRKIFF